MATLLTLPGNTVLPAGAFTSANFTFPSGINSVTTQFAISSADLADAAASMTFELWRETSPGSGLFTFDHGFTWKGGAVSPKTGLAGQPSMTVDVGPLANTKCQVRLTLSKSITSGVTVTSA
ncbi:MAG TPA: hypothetical protein VN921_01530 [Chthoniobacterales bacterium]|nr:hypothetical protein [Chthoniobacterales bacterium]